MSASVFSSRLGTGNGDIRTGDYAPYVLGTAKRVQSPELGEHDDGERSGGNDGEKGEGLHGVSLLVCCDYEVL